jgi:ligand-binding sensor domain-containing protein
MDKSVLSGNISVFDGNAWSTYPGNDSALPYWLTAIAIDRQGVKWFGSLGALLKYDGAACSKYTQTNSGLVDDNINAISIDAQDNKWIGTMGGISVFNGVTWQNHTDTSNPVRNRANSIAIDSEGNKWFGTDGGGVSKFDGQNWTYYDTSNGLANNHVRAVAVDSKGSKWFGTDGGGLQVFDGATWKSYTAKDGLGDNHIYSIAIDDQGVKWIGTRSGVSVFNDNVPVEYPLDSKGVPSLAWLYPNPFNPVVNVHFMVFRDAKVHIAVYDIKGRCIRDLFNGNEKAGSHFVRWNGKNSKGQLAGDGIYIVKTEIGSKSYIRKVVYAK